MIKKFRNFIYDLLYRPRVNIALSKGGAMMLSRQIDLRKPATWEFSGFSQNGEDGIIDILRRHLLQTNRYVIEIGTGDGTENNSSWLIVAEKYRGFMIDGNSIAIRRAKRAVENYSIGAEYVNMFVSVENVKDLASKVQYLDPDVFSLDIDGNDFYIAKELLKNGFRPKIFVVEYNSVFGQEQMVTVKYDKNFAFMKAHPTYLYYGVSIAGWRKFLKSQGYRFVTVDRNGVNAFFVDPNFFSKDFLDGIDSLEFSENQYQLRKFKLSSAEQFKLISDQEFFSI